MYRELQYKLVEFYDWIYPIYVKIYRKYHKYIAPKILKWSLNINRSMNQVLGGPIRTHIDGNVKVIKFKHVNIGVQKDEDLTNENLWTHEFTEYSIGIAITDILIEEGYSIERMYDYLVIPRLGLNLEQYFIPIKHLITSLCTESFIESKRVTPDEFSIFFGICFDKMKYISWNK